MLKIFSCLLVFGLLLLPPKVSAQSVLQNTNSNIQQQSNNLQQNTNSLQNSTSSVLEAPNQQSLGVKSDPNQQSSVAVNNSNLDNLQSKNEKQNKYSNWVWVIVFILLASFVLGYKIFFRKRGNSTIAPFNVIPDVSNEIKNNKPTKKKKKAHR